MKLLAFDATTETASVALFDGDVLLGEQTQKLGMKHSEILLPMAVQLLGEHALTFSDIDAYAVTSGPGSFTGVRIGAATVKGLSFGRSCPIASVSALDALAQNLSGTDGIVIAAMDARRSEIYTATFRSYADGKRERLTEDRAMPIAALAQELKGEALPIYIVGDGYALTHRILSECGIPLAHTPEEHREASAVSVGRCGIEKIRSGDTVTDTALSPTYLRLAQAERERLEREGQGVQKA